MTARQRSSCVPGREGWLLRQPGIEPKLSPSFRAEVQLGRGEGSKTVVLRLVAWVAVLAVALAASSGPAAGFEHAPVAPDFGPNVKIFDPSMSSSDIQSAVNTIYVQQKSNEFGTERHALLFKPGSYGSSANPLKIPVGYYTDVAGLGSSPNDVTINGAVDTFDQCDSTNFCTALTNFWRSVSNLSINVTGSGCEGAAE